MATTKGRIEPNDDLILIRPFGNDKVNGIHLPEESKTAGNLKTAQVLAVGPGVRQHGQLLKMRSEVGDVIIYDHRQGTEMRYGDKRILFLHDSQVYAFVRTEPIKETPQHSERFLRVHRESYAKARQAVGEPDSECPEGCTDHRTCIPEAIRPTRKEWARGARPPTARDEAQEDPTEPCDAEASS